MSIVNVDARSLVCAPLVVSALALSGCSGGGSSTPTEPVAEVVELSVETLEPAEPVVVLRQCPKAVQISWIDNDSEGLAITDLFADRDGDPATTADQISIAGGFPERNGLTQRFDWNPATLEPGTYSVFAVTTGASRTEFDFAPATVTVRDAKQSFIQTREGASDIGVRSGSGNFAVAGRFTDSILFDPDLPTELSLVAAFPETTSYLASYDAQQRVQWATLIASTAYASVSHVETLDNGAHIVAGTFRGVMTLGAGEVNETELVGVQETNIFVAKYGSGGSFRWAQVIQSTPFAGPGSTVHLMTLSGIAGLPGGGVYVTGNFGGDLSLGSAGGEVLFAESDSFIARYSSFGEVDWVVSAGTTVGAPQVYPDESVGVIGGFREPITLGSGSEEITFVADETDSYVARFEPDGKLRWARQHGGPGDASFLNTPFTVGSDSRAYFVTQLTGAEGATLDPGGPDETFLAPEQTHLVVLEPNGKLLETRTLGDRLNAPVDYIASTDDGSLVLGGTFTETLILEGESSSEVVQPVGGSNFYVAKLNADGEFRWLRSAGNAIGNSVKVRDGSVLLSMDLRAPSTIAGGDCELDITSSELVPVFSAESNLFITELRENGEF